MTVNDLKIGNNLLCEGYFTRIIEIKEDGELLLTDGLKKWRTRVDADYVEPIQLDEGWFLSLGFKQTKRIITKEAVYKKEGLFYNDRLDAWWLLDILWKDKKIEYVHTLQNIFYFNFDKELIIEQK